MINNINYIFYSTIIICVAFIIINYIRYYQILPIYPTKHFDKRIAICISGRVESPEIFITSLKKIFIDNCQPDIFLHVNNNTIYNLLLKNNIPVTNIIVCNKNPTKYPTSSLSKNTLKMFERIYECNLLKSQYEKNNNFIYDVVIRMRPDIKFNSYLNFKNIKPDTIYIPKYIGPYMLYITPNIGPIIFCGITDQFCYGSSKIIDKYSNIYTYLINYNNKCIAPEIVLKKYLLYQKINIKFFYADFIIISKYINNIFIYIYKTILKKDLYFSCTCSNIQYKIIIIIIFIFLFIIAIYINK